MGWYDPQNLYQPLVEKKNHPNDENSSINIDEFITNNTELISSSPSASSSRDNINDENKTTNVAVLNNQLKDVRKKQHKTDRKSTRLNSSH